MLAESNHGHGDASRDLDAMKASADYGPATAAAVLQVLDTVAENKVCINHVATKREFCAVCTCHACHATIIRATQAVAQIKTILRRWSDWIAKGNMAFLSQNNHDHVPGGSDGDDRGSENGGGFPEATSEHYGLRCRSCYT
mmetsp:Transcript_27894/g.82702  ORF Transcript_27894/g.82702 Transcript_27894/m.82702 type:complete len:141 (-) Transcript_27894:1171-1593(-)